MTVFQRLGGYDRATAFYVLPRVFDGKHRPWRTGRMRCAPTDDAAIYTDHPNAKFRAIWYHLVGEPVGSSAGLVLTGKDSGLPYGRIC